MTIEIDTAISSYKSAENAFDKANPGRAWRILEDRGSLAFICL
jgi:hypothetical protein